MQEWAACGPDGGAVAGDDQLALLFACCHPALDPASRVTLTLRVVCGLPTASIARLLLLPEPSWPSRSPSASSPGPARPRAAGWATPVTRAELHRRMREGGVLVLDVRPAAEYAAGHVAGAVSGVYSAIGSAG